MALGPENFSLYALELYIGNTQIFHGDIVQVDPAVSQSIRARYKVQNVGATPFHYWECCFTVYDVTHGVAKGSRNDHGQGSLSDWKDRTISVGKITEPTVFRVRIWANQDYNAAPPPQASW